MLEKLKIEYLDFKKDSNSSTQKDDKIWLVSFMNYDLGYFDEDSCRVEPIENPFESKLLPMSPV